MDSAFAKLGRAKEHRDRFAKEIKAFDAANPYDWTFHEVEPPPHPNLAEYEVKARVKSQVPDAWCLIIGDILTNLRAALDHALFSHVESRQTLTEKQESQLQYPVVIDAKNWFGAPAVPATATAPHIPKIESKRDKLAPFVSAKVLTAIEKTQPFSQSRVPPPHAPLALLTTLVNHDKHRRLHVVRWVNEEFIVRHSDWEVVEVKTDQTVLTDGAVMATVTVKRKIAFPWQRADLRGGMFDVMVGYGPAIRVPDGSLIPAGTICHYFIRDVERALHAVRRASR
ncbi:hypothetical protein ACXPWS_05310 [Mycobacterium sp. BMJ-28]